MSKMNSCVPSNTQNKLKKWLDSKVYDNSIENKYEITEFTLKPYKSKYNKEIYYTENDEDCEFLCDLKDNNNLQTELDNYDDHLFIPPNTNRYHTNSLFRQLIDFSIENEFSNNYFVDDGKNGYMKCNIIDRSLKKAFYKFCHDNS